MLRLGKEKTNFYYIGVSSHNRMNEWNGKDFKLWGNDQITRRDNMRGETWANRFKDSWGSILLLLIKYHIIIYTCVNLKYQNAAIQHY